MQELRYRQIHLDFHTSPLIEGIGSDFNPEEFAETLVRARVNSITTFARCHHGWLYYQSKGFPELIHPHLSHPGLLEEQIRACHERGIRVPVYTTIQWDELQSKEHPEWLMRNPDGSPIQHGHFDAGFYNSLCVNTPYLEFLKEQVRDMFESIPVMDGIFLDITQERECSCRHCMTGMEEQGLRPHRKADREAYARKMINDFKHEMTAFIRSFNRDCTIFYNCQAVQQHSKTAYSHIEVESLPSGEWGYDHFAFEARYSRNLGYDILGQTGKFHTAWGDFHSFKTREALEYECFRMLALNSKCMIGDQLEPGGKLSEPVYDLIGSVYRQVEEKEAWCSGALAECDVALFDPREFYDPCRFDHPEALLGAMKMLEQTGIQFDIIDSAMDFSRYSLLILPDIIPAESNFAEKLDAYVQAGGSLILSYRSGFHKNDFDISTSFMPVCAADEQLKDLEGEEIHGRYDYMRNSWANYILPGKEIGKGLPATEHMMYRKNLDVTAREGSTVLAETIAPSFYRDYRHFCSHRQAPSSGRVEGPGIIRKGNVIYFAHNIFTIFQKRAPGWIKTLFRNALEMLIDQNLRHDGPSSLLTALNRQNHKKRYVLHLLHYIPKRSCSTMDIIEDIIPLYKVGLSVRPEQHISAVRLVPESINLDFSIREGRVEFSVPEIKGHQMIELSWK